MKHATPAEKAEIEHLVVDRLCAEKVASHNRGPLFWLRNFTATENYQWQAQGRDPIAPFPYRPHPAFSEEHLRVLDKLKVPHEFSIQDPPDYVDAMMALFLDQLISGEKEQDVPKSREMMTSWTAVGYITWHCQFFPATGWVGQSEKDDKAQGLVKYANILYRNQPDWLKKLHPLVAQKDEGSKHKIEWEGASWFIGVPQGERQLASHHPFGYFNDESAHQPAWLATVSVARPAVRQIINVSSAAASNFGIECELQG